MDMANVSKEETLYIGDGKTDIETAKNAGVDMALVTWGSFDEENIKDVKYVIDDAKMLKEIVLEK